VDRVEKLSDAGEAYPLRETREAVAAFGSVRADNRGSRLAVLATARALDRRESMAVEEWRIPNECFSKFPVSQKRQSIGSSTSQKN